MATEPLASLKSSLYDKDFLVWTQETARLLRAGRPDKLDIDHLAEEVEDMGKSQRRERDNRLMRLILHLLEWRYQPNRRSGSWKRSIDVQRVEISRLLGDSASLRRTLPQAIAEVCPDAVRGASLETSLPAGQLSEQCPFTPDQILDRDFLPE